MTEDIPNIFKDDHMITVMVNRTVKGKVPEGYNWGRYHAGFKREQMSPYHLAADAYRGWAFCPAYEGTRKQTNFTEAWHIGFDFDSSSLEQVKAIPWVDWFASFGYTTPSHTPENPKCRVVFVFDEPITDAGQYRDLYHALAWRFQIDGIATDPACKDVLRLYFGSPGCEVWTNWSVLAKASQAELIRQWRDVVPAQNEYKPKPVKAAPVESLSARFLEVAAGKLLARVRDCPDGEKHYTLRKISYVFGGYVAGGYYTESDAIGWLEDAIHPRAANKQLASKTIIDCLTAGKGEPLGFAERLRVASAHSYDLRGQL